MKNFLSGFSLVLVLCFAGCTEKPGQDAAGSERDAAERSGQAVEAEKPAAPGAQGSATAAESSEPETGTSEEDSSESASSESASSVEASPTGEALKNFEAGIAAYQANDLPLAYQKFRAAAEKGHADSQYNLGLMYEQGIGVERDEMQAVAWYGKAAAQGNSAAQYNLGVLHENGRGTKVDFAQANKWYRSASVQGDPLAIGNLGMLYVRGDGVPVNKIAGVALLLISAQMDPSPNNNARRNIAGTRGLSPEMIAAAQKLSGELSTAENLLVPLDEFLKQSESKQ